MKIFHIFFAIFNLRFTYRITVVLSKLLVEWILITIFMFHRQLIFVIFSINLHLSILNGRLK